MTIKNCTSCKALITTKNAVKKGRDAFGLYFNCQAKLPDGQTCDSTVMLRAKNWKELIEKAVAS